MTEIKIVYVDDHNDEILSKYINEVYLPKTLLDQKTRLAIKKTFEEVPFIADDGYEALLHDARIRSANVIIIDNHLFEERSAGSGKFSGKQFKIILRKILPFVEVLVITQDEQLDGDNIIHKYSGKNGTSPNTYYGSHLDVVIDAAIKQVLDFEALADDLKNSTDVEKALVDKILQSLQGDNSFDPLTKADIDNLIASFKELKDEYTHKK